MNIMSLKTILLIFKAILGIYIAAGLFALLVALHWIFQTPINLETGQRDWK